MVALRMDREVLNGLLNHPTPDESSGSEHGGSNEAVKENATKIVDSMHSQKRMEQKLAQTVLPKLKLEVNDLPGGAAEDRPLQVLRTSERSEEEDVIDVSPSGCTLSSLSTAMQETASRVKNMFVFDNSFTVLPSSIQNFKNLRKLKFFSNEVRTLPQELGELTQLEHLYLKICPAGLGTLPPLDKLRSLRALELHQVPVRPSASTLSREIAQLHSLTRLSVCHFSISWVPAEIGTLKHLEELDLSFNKLKVLPKELAGLTALKTLRVASNKLIELPSELTSLPNLTSIDVAHNRLTSLDSLGLVSMTSLRALNAQFNKLQKTGVIPNWVSCELEGNERLQSDPTKSDDSTEVDKEEFLLDWEPPSAEESLDGFGGGSSLSSPTPFAGKGSSPTSKGQPVSRSRRGWKKQDNQQQKARQDRLNSSRKHRSEDHVDFNEVTTPVVSADPLKTLDVHCKNASSSELKPSRGNGKQLDGKELYASDEGKGLCVAQHVRRNEDAVDSRKELQIDEDVHKLHDTEEQDEESFRDSQPEHMPLSKVQVVHVAVSRLGSNERNICRKAISGDRPKVDQVVTLLEYQNEDPNESNTDTLRSCLALSGVKVGRRQDGDNDRNPKPSKRRRSVQEFSEVSFKYCTESFCGFEDRLHDGFYDAGRDRPFSSLAALEKEQPCYDSREVILVDREKDEELDVMALSAQQLLAGLESSVEGDGKVNVFQRMTFLALFVSDCFGGSDKTQNISNMRRAALGGTAGMPFVCSCSSSVNGNLVNKVMEKSNAGAVLPSVHMLCEGAVRFLKAQRGSNVLPIGSLSFGVCRHRAILFKYLCDRADPIIPCELVRGYLDYMPHAWNVVLVEASSGSTRMLVDACRPLDIRPERDPEYFCRYIPLRRIHLPRISIEVLKTSGSESSRIPLLHEDIGHGASGAVVRRCSFGKVTAAAKVRQLETVAEGPGVLGKGLESSCLSELRMLCSLQPHPCIVAFYGHQLTSGFTTSPDEGAAQAPQLMIFMEYIKGGSLEGFLQELAAKGQTHMDPDLALHVARNVACAISVLHSKGIIHRDVKSSNVLIDLEASQDTEFPGPVVKLCDFDSAVPLQSSSEHTCYLAHRGVPPADVCVGTPRWIAPEVLRAMYGRHSYGLEADLWSFGCLLAELLTLKVPFAGLSETEVHSRIQMGQRPQLPAEIDKFRSPPAASSAGKETVTYESSNDSEVLSILVRLFYSCTDPSPSSRPSAKEVLNILATALAERSCTTVASLDEPILQDETPEEALDVPKRLLSPKVDEESPKVKKESIPVCSLPNKSCSCTNCGKKVGESSSVESSNPDSCNDT
ncbi:hypothetical protein MPTK1_1g03380 [Marchantia polymorpha subsp. ruderalis]|uniref:Protein kinase domain-containing protein n=2 Tax=Marchantia polymorpha TaxID=3197 RepID=A0AAF6AL31_MARPO|nr:hypothetical protein MARPO_0005s0269 [Marchantia polymorpha]BBM97151.1 hypothetical protein Mp_1g03380 [Marchantia polymorpha subsp. ruderalis]|eukprot:PTQ48654.1 hypothetical protein MARPO_0005s0269 [Marchantia polymorpha]